MAKEPSRSSDVDISTAQLCVCVCAHLYVCVWGPGDYLNLINTKLRAGFIFVVEDVFFYKFVNSLIIQNLAHWMMFN